MATRGRPRTFDRAEGLRQAMHVFWRLGYEGTTLPDLQAAMGGLTAPSIYAAFGSKDALFREALDLYHATIGAGPLQALTGLPTARASIDGMLRALVDSVYMAETPRGCMAALGALGCTRASKDIVQPLVRQAKRSSVLHASGLAVQH